MICIPKIYYAFISQGYRTYIVIEYINVYDFTSDIQRAKAIIEL